MKFDNLVNLIVSFVFLICIGIGWFKGIEILGHSYQLLLMTVLAGISWSMCFMIFLRSVQRCFDE